MKRGLPKRSTRSTEVVLKVAQRNCLTEARTASSRTRMSSAAYLLLDGGLKSSRPNLRCCTSETGASLPSRASSSRMGVPPISKMTLPVGTLKKAVKILATPCNNDAYRVAQNSNVPFPFPIRVSLPYTIFMSVRDQSVP